MTIRKKVLPAIAAIITIATFLLVDYIKAYNRQQRKTQNVFYFNIGHNPAIQNEPVNFTVPEKLQKQSAYCNIHITPDTACSAK
jgi:hypothetical protein